MTDQIKAAKSALIAQAEVLGVEPQTIIDFLGKYELPDIIIQVNNLRRAKWTAQENGKPDTEHIFAPIAKHAGRCNQAVGTGKQRKRGAKKSCRK